MTQQEAAVENINDKSHEREPEVDIHIDLYQKKL